MVKAKMICPSSELFQATFAKVFHPGCERSGFCLGFKNANSCTRIISFKMGYGFSKIRMAATLIVREDICARLENIFRTSLNKVGI